MKHEKFNLATVEETIVQIRKDMDVIEAVGAPNGEVKLLLGNAAKFLEMAEGQLHEAADFVLDDFATN